MHEWFNWYVCMGMGAADSRASAYISVKSRAHMLQLLCNTFITIVTTLVGWMPQVIVTLTPEVIAKYKI